MRDKTELLMKHKAKNNSSVKLDQSGVHKYQSHIQAARIIECSYLNWQYVNDKLRFYKRFSKWIAKNLFFENRVGSVVQVVAALYQTL